MGLLKNKTDTLKQKSRNVSVSARMKMNLSGYNAMVLHKDTVLMTQETGQPTKNVSNTL